jgi:predicted transcriptional regulator of viral defense system
VTIADLREAVGASVARDVASRLVTKKVLERVGRGKYLVRPLRTQTRPTTVSPALQVAILLHGERYYLGGLWAMTVHRLTEQQYVSVLDAFVARRHFAKRLGATRVAFHRIGSERFRYGVGDTEIEGLLVRVSDRERTVRDLLVFPAMFGGVSQALRNIERVIPDIDHAKLADYAARGARNSTCQRLGVLLERAGMTPRRLARLHDRVEKTKSVLSMDPDAPRAGRFNRRWSVVENDR